MTKDELINFLKQSQGFKSRKLERAFNEVDRADFVLQVHRDRAYEDYPLPIGNGATISQPTTVLFMLNLLDPKQGEKILDVGAGSGWTTALLARAVGKRGAVWGTELVLELVEFGSANLKKYDFPNAKIGRAVELGLPVHAPYDKILVSAASKKFPKELIGQLKPGGRIVAPIQHSVWVIDKISENKIDTNEYPGFVFVPLR